MYQYLTKVLERMILIISFVGAHQINYERNCTYIVYIVVYAINDWWFPFTCILVYWIFAMKKGKQLYNPYNEIHDTSTFPYIINIQIYGHQVFFSMDVFNAFVACLYIINLTGLRISKFTILLTSFRYVDNQSVNTEWGHDAWQLYAYNIAQPNLAVRL